MKKFLVLTIALALVCGSVFAQGQAEAAAAPAEPKIEGEITILIPNEFTANADSAIFRAVKEFETTYPGTKVNVESLTGKEITSKYTTQGLAGAGPDVVALDNAGWPINMAAMGIVSCLDDEIKASGNAYLQGPLDSGLYEGSYYSVPWYFNNTALYYNKRILSEIGYDHTPVDWAELEDCVAKATALGYYGIATRLDGYHVFNFFMAQNNPVIDTTGKTPVITVNNESGKKAFNFYAGLQTKYNCFPESMKEANNWAKAYIPFIQDKALFLICGDWAYVNIKKGNPDLDFSIAQMPKGEVVACCLGGYNLCVNKNTSNYDTAWAFVKFLTSKGCDYVLFEAGRVPARSDVDYSAVMARNPDFKVFLDEGPYVQPRPRVVNAAKVDELVSNAFSKVLFGMNTPQEALDALEKDLEAFVKENY